MFSIKILNSINKDTLIITSLLSSNYRKKLDKLAFFNIAIGALESINIIIIYFLATIITNKELLYKHFQNFNPIYLVIIFLTILLCITLVKIFAYYNSNKIIAKISTHIEYLLIRKIHRTIEKNNNNKVIGISNEVLGKCVFNITNSCILPFYQLFNLIPLCILSIFILSLIDPIITLFLILFISLFYKIIFNKFKKVLKNFNNISNENFIAKSKIVHKIQKDFRTYSTSNIYKNLLKDYKIFSGSYNLSSYLSQFYSTLPKYLFELIFYFSIAIMSVFIINAYYDASHYLALFITLIIASIRLIPNFQLIFQNISQIISISPTLKEINNFYSVINNSQRKTIILSKDCIVELSLNFKNRELSFKSGINLIKGVSGIGKTTLLDKLAGIGDADVSLRYGDKQIVSNAYFQPNHISYCPQFPQVFENEINFENINLIKSNQNLNPNLKFSGGELKKIGISRALNSETNVILLDEPMTGLDKLSIYEVKKLLQKFSNRILIIVTHDEFLDDIANEIYILDNNDIK